MFSNKKKKGVRISYRGEAHDKAFFFFLLIKVYDLDSCCSKPTPIGHHGDILGHIIVIMG